MTHLYNEFIGLLKKKFGKYDDEHHRFESYSNSEIARELGYSDAQFSRLINGTATDGEYQRAMQNIERILLIDKLESQVSTGKNIYYKWRHHSMWFYLVLVLAVAISAYVIVLQPGNSNRTESHLNSSSRDATLQWVFETSYVKPYVSLDDLPADCNYPCYKYQGKWNLKKSYKLPFFREQNGYHYVATAVNMYARCMSEESDAGNLLEGYEYQKHEIWYDKRELPVDSFMIANGQLRADYQKLNFNRNEHFVLLATVHTFFRNKFKINPAQVERSGKVIGRDVEVSTDEALRAHLNADQIDKVKSEINRIARDRLEDFSRPVSCANADVPVNDFGLIKDGDEMSFNCQLTTSRVALDYQKTYVLTDQYIKNRCRPAENLP